MAVTVSQLIRNPILGSSFLIPRKKILEMFRDSYLSLKKDIELKAVKKDFEKLTVFLKVPSEKETKDFKFDVIIQFDISDPKITLDTKIKIFTNAHNFVFTYAYAFETHSGLIEKYKSFLPKECLTIPSKVRNPNNIPGFVKQVYFAFEYLREIQFFKNYSTLVNNREIIPMAFSEVEVKYKEALKNKKLNEKEQKIKNT